MYIKVRQTDTDIVRDKAEQRVVHRIIAPDKKLVFSGGALWNLEDLYV